VTTWPVGTGPTLVPNTPAYTNPRIGK
jgi:hypothetical protein